MVKQILIISSIFFLLLGSCTGAKKIVDEKETNAELSAEESLRKVRATFLDFQTLNSNTDLYVNSSMFTGSIGAKLRIVKDSVIWMSASKFGFEVARVLITKDSVFMVERVQKTYIRESIEALSELAGVSVGYDVLQDFLVGNPYLDEGSNEVAYYTGDTLSIKPAFNEIDIKHLVDKNDFKLLQTTVRDDKSKMDAGMGFEDYRALEDEQIFSYFRNITLDNGVDEPTTASIKFNNPELNIEKAIKFSIPDSYTPRKF